MSWIPVARITILAGIVCGAALCGCNTQGSALEGILIPLPPSTPVVNQPRHPPPPKKQPVVLVMDPLVGPPEVDWKSAYESLPRDKKGAVDWMQALDQKLVTPKPGIAPDAEPASTKEDEVQFVSNDTPTKSATFRHATHTQWLTCKNCHPGVFKKKDDNLQFTHDDMDAGKYCGACHFKVVVVQNGCYGCHPKKTS